MLTLTLAFRNILRNKRRSLFTIISLGGGYFLLSIMLSMSEGSYNHIINVFTRDHTGHIQIHKQDYLQRASLYKTIDNIDELLTSLQQVPQVLSIAPRIYGPSLAYGKNKTFPANVIGISPQHEAQTTFLKHKVQQGQYLTTGITASGYFPAMIGYSLAKNLRLNVGDELVLISQGIDGSIANDIFEVTAIVGTADSFERLNVYLSLTAMQTFLSMKNTSVHELAMSLKHQSDAEKVAQQLQHYLDGLFSNTSTSKDLTLSSHSPAKEKQPQLTVSPWQVVESSFYNSMQADKKGNYISMAIIIFIVSIGVLNTILMGTLERTREFGVLKAIGTRPLALFKLIMLESFILAIISCFFGALLALPFNYWLAVVGIAMPEPIDMGGITFATLLGEVSYFVMGLPLLVVIGSTLCVSLIPAIRAARIVPLKALQST